MPKVTPRRPYIDEEPDGYQESDRDYAENNLDAAVWALDHADRIRAAFATSGDTAAQTEPEIPAAPSATKIEIEVSTENDGSSFPWWMIVRPPLRRSVAAAALAITGPFFSRAEATKELESRRYHYGDKAIVWCLSGCDSGQYREAMKRAGRDGR